MKKVMPILIIGILVISGFGAIADFDVNDNNFVIKDLISFSQPLIKEKDQYIILNIEETNSQLINTNKPILPMHIKTYTFPIGTKILEIECNPYNIQQQYITKKISPSPKPVLIGSKIYYEDKLNSYIEDPYPNKWYEYDIGCGIDKNEQTLIVKVQTYPIQYYPSENMIKIANDFAINIKYKEEKEQPLKLKEEYKFIILTPAEYINPLNNLVDYKNNRNLSTKLITLDEIYSETYFTSIGRDNQEKIKYFIKNAIENWDTTFVLLVGGSQKFPVRETHIRANSDDSEIFVSDLYYADIYNETFQFSSWDTNENDIFGEYNWGADRHKDEIDLYPNVYLGRIACVDNEEVITSVNKIITYESMQSYSSEWFTNIVTVGGDSFPGDGNEISEGELVNDAVINIMDGFIPERIWASNGRLSGISPTGVSEISEAINEGCGFIDFSGHGNTAVWATHAHENEDIWLPTPSGNFRNSRVAELTNGEKLPIVVTGACSVGKYNRDDDCFSWSFISNPNGGGIGSFGATGLGWAYTGSWVTEGLIEGMSLNIFKAYENAITFGELWVNAITNYISPGMEGTDYKTIEEWQAFGDPSLLIGSDSLSPEKPETPKGPSTGNIKIEHTYNTTTTDPEGDEIYYLFDWGNGEFSGWIGPYPSGEKAFTTYQWSQKGDYQIRVKAKDIHGSMSEWSDSIPITMSKEKRIINQNLIDILEKIIINHSIIKTILGI